MESNEQDASPQSTPLGPNPSRDDLCSAYLDQLPYDPYPVQEEALLAWFSTQQGVLVCAPTGTGKTLIAEAAVFEALHSGSQAYYTTPLIALTEQKFRELQEAAVRWGFAEHEIGLTTGNRRVNPEARIQVVVAEILLNRLLAPDSFDFSRVAAVVMDEFHSFADPERGIVWELSLQLLPPHVRLLLLSATVGNSGEFLAWLSKQHRRRLELVQSTERKVPLSFQWVPDELLNEQLEIMSSGDEDARRTPALVFCFNRNECWDVAEQLKGKHLVDRETQKKLAAELDKSKWNEGAGPKLKQILMRGVGVHHAGLLPRYKRIVEHLFQRKLLSVAVCTETLAAGMNLPARSVVLTSLLKGPPQKKKVIDASTAHQIFGRAGRPQFDDHGYVYALAHEDDVKILRWKEKYDQIPEDTPDPNLRRAKKQLKKKMPTRRSTQQYWNEQQFEKLREAPPGKLFSRGPLPWRLLAHLLQYSPDVARLKSFLRNRLTEARQIEQNEKELTRMLLTLWAAGYVTLDPEPPPRQPAWEQSEASEDEQSQAEAEIETPAAGAGLLGQLIEQARSDQPDEASSKSKSSKAARDAASDDDQRPAAYEPQTATPGPRLHELTIYRSVNPVYAGFLMDHFAQADEWERLQLLESVLDVPGSLFFQVRTPGPDRVPPGRLATEFLDEECLRRGLATADELRGPSSEEEVDPHDERRRDRPLAVAEKMRRYFDSEYPGVHSLRTRPVWIAGDLLEFAGDFDKYIRGRDLTKQEGIVFRHLLRLILLAAEFSQLTPRGMDESEWRAEMQRLADTLTESCRRVDPASTDEIVEALQNSEIEGAKPSLVPGTTTGSAARSSTEDEESFAEGIFPDNAADDRSAD